MSFSYFSKNGTILPISQAIIPLENIHYQYGFGVYETLKVRNTILYFAEQHIERLLQSAEIIGLQHPFTNQQIRKYIEDLIKENGIGSCNIKMLLIGGDGPGDSLLFILPLAPLYPNRKLYAQGATTSTVQYERFLPNAKTLNMLASYLSYTQASKKGHYDALLLDRENTILEGTRTNFFGIQDNILITPSKEVVLDGVTRQTVTAVAQKNGFIVKEEKIPLASISQLDGAFFTSTSSKIIPIVKIDSFAFAGIPPKLRELMKLYDHFLDTCNGIFNE